jgi:hypothetical protein
MLPSAIEKWVLPGETRVLGMYGRPSASLNMRCYLLPLPELWG